jgi:hypothetical protein
MTNAPAHAPVFSRGSTVLEYWLVHAEGLTVQPLGARVEKVVVAAPEGRAESLVVRSGVTRRRTRIPAGAIAAVQPSAGELHLDPAAAPHRSQVHIPHPSPDRIAEVARATQRGTASVARRTQRGSVDAAAWARPRVAHAADRTAQGVARATEQTARGLAWLTPRVVAGVRTVSLVTAQLVFAGAVLLTRVAAQAARAAASAAAQGRASIEARRAKER